MSTLQRLAAQFIVDSLPVRATVRRRVSVPPSPRATAPRDGTQLLRWVIEEADEQHGFGTRTARVKLSRRDVKVLRYLEQWIHGIERERS